jgi:redox-sensitive bicupin YhaK (pirin superfamily)
VGALEAVIAPRVRPVGRGTVQRLLPFRLRRTVGPFVFADLMGPEHLAPGVGMDVDAHPHIGLSTLTYLFSGEVVHRDSTGAVQTIEPGAVGWMTAGSGVCHTERSSASQRSGAGVLHGLQTWVALPDGDEDVAPSFQHAGPASIPTFTDGGATVRVAAGTGWGCESPVPGSSPLVLAEVRLRQGGRLPIDAAHRERAVLPVDGDVTLDGEPVPAHHLAVITPGHRPVLEGTGMVMVLGGAPLGPRKIWWNFVHSQPEAIEEARRRWADQRFPLVPGDHDPWVPLPGD